MMFVYVGVLLLAGGLFSVFEGKSFYDSAWWAVVTATTVGYGDISPVTLGGRVVGGLLMHVVPFIVAPVIIANILEKVIQDRNEFTHEEQIRLEAKVDSVIELVSEQSKTTGAR